MKVFGRIFLYMTILSCFSAAFAQQYSKPSSITYDAKREVWYVASRGETGYRDGTIIKRFNDGRKTYISKNDLFDPQGLLLSGDSLFFTDGQNLGVIELTSYKITSFQKIAQAGELTDICMDSKGRLFVADTLGLIHRINPKNYSDQQLILMPQNKKPMGLTFDASGKRILFAYFEDNSPIDAMDIDNLNVIPFAKPNLRYPLAMARDSKGNNYIACQGAPNPWGRGGKIYRFNSSYSDEGEIYLTNLTCPYDVYIDTENDVLGIALNQEDDIALLNLEQKYKSPTLLMPVNNEVEVGTVLTLSWTAITNAGKYELNVSKSPTFDSLVIKLDSYLTEIEISGLELNTKYYWRVKANSAGRDGAWSTVRNFKTASRSYTPPVQLSPVDGFKYANIYPIFVWNSVKAGIYKLEIAQDPYMLGVFYGISDITDTTYRLPFKLERDQTYYWRVKSYSGMVESQWSQIKSFRTELFRYYWPPLLLPVNNAKDVEPYFVDLTWEPREPKRYSIMLSKNENCEKDTVLFVKEYKDTTYRIAKPLETGTTYYWQVRTHDDTTGTWSVIYQFTTASKSGVNQELNKIANIYPNPCRDLLNIEDFDLSGRFAEINIYDETGALSYYESAFFDNKGKYSVDTKKLSSGVYKLTIKTGEFQCNSVFNVVR